MCVAQNPWITLSRTHLELASGVCSLSFQPSFLYTFFISSLRVTIIHPILSDFIIVLNNKLLRALCLPVWSKICYPTAVTKMFVICIQVCRKESVCLLRRNQSWGGKKTWRRVALNGSRDADSLAELARPRQVLEEKQVLAALHVCSTAEDRLWFIFRLNVYIIYMGAWSEKKLPYRIEVVCGTSSGAVMQTPRHCEKQKTSEVMDRHTQTLIRGPLLNRTMEPLRLNRK